MKTLLFFCLPLFIACNFSSEEKKTDEITKEVTTYYLIRHAEKDRSDPSNSNPSLTDDGQQRAERWAAYFKAKNLNAVYSTNYNRTQETATPTAQMLDVSIQSYDPRNLFDEGFQKETKGKTVLVVGHSNTTPQFANAIIGRDSKLEDMSDTENGIVYIVIVEGETKSVTIENVD
jgi:phosphohistidine phosphatase SixA